MSRMIRFGLFIFCTFITPTNAADLVITPMGLFPSCDDAVKFRNGALVDALDKLRRQWDPDKEKRIADAFREFEGYRASFIKEIDKANAAKRAVLKRGAVQVLAALTIKHLAKGALKHSPPGTTREDKEALQIIIEGSGGLATSAATAAFEGKLDLTETIVTRSKMFIELLEPYARAAANMHPVTVLAFRVFDVAIIGSPIGFEWLEKDADRREGEAKLAQVEKSIERLFKKSGAAVIRDIEKTKSSIDKHCNGPEARARAMANFGERTISKYDDVKRRVDELEAKTRELDTATQRESVRQEVQRLNTERRAALVRLQEIDDELRKELARAEQAAKIASMLDAVSSGLSWARAIDAEIASLPASDQTAIKTAPSGSEAKRRAELIERRSRSQSRYLEQEWHYRKLKIEDFEMEQFTIMRNRRLQ